MDINNEPVRFRLQGFIENFIERDKMDFRAEIKKLMQQKKISIAKLARDADLNYCTVYYFLKGKSQMRTANLEKLFDILIKI
jgi:predicted transcriptional regulator